MGLLRWLAPFGLCLIFLAAESTESDYVDSNGRCIKSGSFPSDCNTCFCVKDKIPGCTYKGCLHKRSAPQGKTDAGGKCKPGTKWKLDSCNDCVCTHTGYASCSLNECPSNKSRGKRATESKQSAGEKCKPGDKWKLDECNNCICTHTGYASCTLNECTSTPKKRGRRSASLSKPLGLYKMDQHHPLADI